MSDDRVNLRVADLRAAIRLAAELGQFAPGSAEQRRHFLAELAKLVGGSVTIWCDVKIVPSGRVVIESADDQGWSDDSKRVRLQGYLEAQAEVEDPTIIAMRPMLRMSEVVTRSRRELASDAVWYRCEHFQEYRGPAGLDDCIYSTLTERSGLQCFSIHRPVRDRAFNDSEIALVGALHSGCARILDPPDVKQVAGLSRRQRQILQGLARGLSDKEIASELDLSPNTLHGYMKTLYQRLGVRSRLEAVTRFARAVSSNGAGSHE
jgi:DNA-binding CsgD family transcriptional regulator